MATLDGVRAPEIQSGPVEIVRTVEGLDEIDAFWRLRRTNRDGDLDFYRLVVLSRDEVVRPHVLVLRRAGVPEAMLIGRLEHRRLDIGNAYLGLKSPVMRSLVFIDGGVAADLSADESEAMARSIFASLRAGEADLAIIEHLRVRCPFYERLTRLAAGTYSIHRPPTLVHRVRRLGGKPLMAGLSANERYNQQRRERRFLAAFPSRVRIDCFHNGIEIDALMRDVERVARHSYQRGLGVGFSPGAEMRRRLLLEGARGTLRAHILYAGDQPCAFWITSLFNGVLYNDFMAYDPAFAKYAPGMYLVVRVIDEVSRDPSAGEAPVVDFGAGDAEWKTRLANDAWEEASLHLFAPTVKGMSVKALRTAGAITARLLKKGLDRSSLLPRVKRLWRNRMSGR